MKNVTLSARAEDIEAARKRARAEHTTLNEQFRAWLASYGRQADPAAEFDALMNDLGDTLVLDHTPTRDERNAR